VALPHPELDDVRVRFVTFRDGDADARAGAASAFAELGAAERVVLETCHRVELVSVFETGPSLRGDHVSGSAAVRRLFEVVAGFDSAVVAEEQLLGQARAAYETAMAAGTSGPVLNELFRRAIRFGRHVRSHARPGADRSLADRAVAWLAERLPERGAAVAVVGTGEMGRLLAHGLAGRGHDVTIVSRSHDRAARLVESLPSGRHATRAGPVDSSVVLSSDAVAIAVRAAAPILTAAHLSAGTTPWTADLSVPSSVEPAAARILGDRLVTLDGLGDASGRTSALDPIVERRLRGQVHDEVESFTAWLRTRRAADAVAVLHGEADAIRRRHLERLQRRAELTDAQLAAVEASSAAMVAELLHGPSIRLRHGGIEAAAVRRLFELEP